MRKTGKSKFLLSILLSMAMSFSLVVSGCSCSGDKNSSGSSSGSDSSTEIPEPETPEVTITMSQASIQMIVGDYKQLTIAYSKLVDGLNLEWSSENSQIATVKDGVVEAISEGTTTIKAKYGEAEATCQVQVSFGEASPLLKLGVPNSFCIGLGDEFKFSPKVIFNGREFTDGTFTYTSSDTSVLAVQGNVLTALKTGTVKVYIQGSWRGKTVENAPALQTVVDIEVTDLIEIRLSGNEHSSAFDVLTLYTINSFDGNEYKTSEVFIPVVYKNSTLVSDAICQISNSREDIIVLNETTNCIEALSYGEAILTVSVTIDGKIYSKTFNVEVLRPEAIVENAIEYFCIYTGTLKDANTFTEQTVIEHILGDNSIEIVDAYQEEVQLRVENNRIFGLSNNANESYQTTLKVGTATAIYYVNATVYGMYITQPSDLSVFVLNSDKTEVNLYVELGNDINAQNYTLPKGNFQITSKKEGKGFTGVLDGNGYAIKNLTLQSNQGLFGAVTYGTIKNIAFLNWLYVDGFSQTTGILGVNVEGAKLNNVCIKISQLPKVSQGANVLASYKIEGGTYKYVYLEYAQDIGDVTYNNCYSAFGAIKPSSEPTFENCLVVSRAPIGVCKTEQSNLQVAVASNVDSDYASALSNDIKQSYATENGKDANSLTVKIMQFRGIRQYDSVIDLQKDSENTRSILNSYSTEYWTVSENKLLWGADNPDALEEGTIYLDLGIVAGKYVSGIQTIEIKANVGDTITLPTNISCMGYSFKGWQYLGEMLPDNQIVNYNGSAMTVVAIWEKDSGVIQTPII